MNPGPALQKTKLPKDFYSNSINCGVRKYRPDLGIVWSDRDSVAAGVFTQSQAKAAAVRYCQEILPSNKVRCVLTNSGQANAATGPQGTTDNRMLVEKVASEFQLQSDQVIINSTGIIGVPLEMEKLHRGIEELKTRSSETAEPFAVAIMTTDLIPKSAYRDIKLSGGTVRLTGICKGSGMIHPNMATMLGYLFTDAKLNTEQAQSMVKESADLSFNMISVDGETSTNDSYVLMANGATGVELQNSEDEETFREAVNEMAIFLAKSIASDGEGASKLIEVSIRGCHDSELARGAARSITISPLIKTAIHGEDPNWGRIYARLGQYGVPEDLLDKFNLQIQGIQIVENGSPVSFDYYKMKTSFSNDVVRIDIDLRAGDHSATAWGCDLSKKYIDINTEYN
jgi:glutamate N-acetyltransferase/amino-acid N-acetyltransferase